MTANNLELVFSENDQENLEKLLNEDIDYMLVDDLLIQYMLKYQVNDVNNYLSIASTPFETKSLHFALNKKTPNAKEIMSQFNAEIKAMVKDGSYNEVLGLNWIEADVNNDGIPELVLIGDSAGLEAPKTTYSIFSTTTKSKGFYIAGQHYSTWESIPYKYKNTNSFTTPSSPQNTGLNIQF